jgi:hypothetical protein
MNQSPKTYVNLPADSNAKSGNASLSALYFNNASSTILATSAYSLQRQYVIQSHMNVLDNKQFDNFDIHRLFFTVILVFDLILYVK